MSTNVKESYDIVRPFEYDAFPEYKPRIVESALSKYVLEVDPLSFDESRMSWSFRSPGLGVLMKSCIDICFTVRVRSGLNFGYVANLGPQFQIIDVSNGNAGAFLADAQTCIAGPACKIAFGQSDCIQKAITSLQVVVNGASLSQTRQRDYMRSLQHCWWAPSVFQRRFSGAGGTPNKYDCTAVQGEVLNLGTMAPYPNNNRTPTMVTSGFTSDSGLHDRLKNLLAATASLPAGDGANDYRDIRVRWKLNGLGLFSPLQMGDKQSFSSPYTQSARALPQMNVVSINILFADLKKALIRNLSSVLGDAGAGAGNTLAGAGDNGIEVTFPEAVVKPKMYIEYLRLGNWRGQINRIKLATFRVAVHDPTSDVFSTEASTTVQADLLDGAGGVSKCLCPIGFDRNSGNCAPFGQLGHRTVRYNGITAAQIPNFIFVVCEKQLDLVTQGSLQARAWDHPRGAIVGGARVIAQVDFAQVNDQQARLNASRRNQFMARNTDANLSISKFKLEIMALRDPIYFRVTHGHIKKVFRIYIEITLSIVTPITRIKIHGKHTIHVYYSVSRISPGAFQVPVLPFRAHSLVRWFMKIGDRILKGLPAKLWEAREPDVVKM